MPDIQAHYLVSGYEILRQGGAWKFQNPFCDNQPFDVAFGESAYVLTTLDLGSGYSVEISGGILGQVPELLYWLHKTGSPFSDGLLGVTKGDVVGLKLPTGATGAPFPYWFFYANVDTDLKVWIRFMEANPPAQLRARDAKEREIASFRKRV